MRKVRSKLSCKSLLTSGITGARIPEQETEVVTIAEPDISRMSRKRLALLYHNLHHYQITADDLMGVKRKRADMQHSTRMWVFEPTQLCHLKHCKLHTAA